MARSPQRRLVISLAQVGDSAVISIEDSGHGFGLHSCIVEAKALNGTVTADSPGPGQGSRFVLWLPRPRDPDG